MATKRKATLEVFTTAVAKCKKCHKESTYAIDQTVAETLWLCPHCQTLNSST